MPAALINPLSEISPKSKVTANTLEESGALELTQTDKCPLCVQSGKVGTMRRLTIGDALPANVCLTHRVALPAQDSVQILK